jgi:hypothetical protein
LAATFRSERFISQGLNKFFTWAGNCTPVYHYWTYCKKPEEEIYQHGIRRIRNL